MMRMTGYPTAIIAQMITRGDVTARGVVPGERAVPFEIFRDNKLTPGPQIGEPAYKSVMVLWVEAEA